MELVCVCVCLLVGVVVGVLGATTAACQPRFMPSLLLEPSRAAVLDSACFDKVGQSCTSPSVWDLMPLQDRVLVIAIFPSSESPLSSSLPVTIHAAPRKCQNLRMMLLIAALPSTSEQHLSTTSQPGLRNRLALWWLAWYGRWFWILDLGPDSAGGQTLSPFHMG